MDKERKIKQVIKENYGRIIKNNSSCCSSNLCCGNDDVYNNKSISEKLGYSEEELDLIPKESNFALGCGNPQNIALLKEGEFVLDLGSGAGLDCFLASKKVGISGKVIGVDMTLEMIQKANENAKKSDFSNVEFKLGEIEELPIENNFIDVIISNCVINLSTNKQRVFDEAFRVLKKGGRLAISDIVSKNNLSDKIKSDLELHSACISGASSVLDIEKMLLKSGFENIEIKTNSKSYEFIKDWSKKLEAGDYIISASITAKKPKNN